jgi:GntR family transcriptional repressor for pyruvate dehydrogenase complex
MVKTTTARSPRPQVKKAEQLARDLVNLVLRKGLRAGEMLATESQMITDYQVSRGTVREALRFLEVQGLISVKRGSDGGPILEQLSAIDYARMSRLHFQMQGSTYGEILVARSAIEPMMARLAAERQDPAALKSLQETVAQADKLKLSDVSQLQDAFKQFHILVSSVSGNTVLDLIGASLREVFHNRPLDAKVSIFSQTRKVHRQIAESIISGDGDRAEKLMRAHLGHLKDRPHSYYSPDIDLDARITWQ